MDPVIFLEKVRQPAVRGLVRERLQHRMTALTGNGGGDQVSLGLVIGPPGSGKTTLLSHIAAASGRSAWYRVGSEDDDESALARHLAHTLAAALGPAGEALSVAERSPDLRIAELVRSLEDPALNPVQLVIDDLHEIAATRAEPALEQFLTLRPHKIRITLGSRRPPNINTSRLLVSGDLIQIDSEDLRFRSWEVEELFRAVYEAPLSPEAAAALTRRTGGWAAGLQLFHLATMQLSRVDRERAVQDLNGRSRLVRSYLARNVLDGLAPDRRRFLLLTSALGALTGDLCDALLDTAGSAVVLAELEREQFFTTSTDAGLTYHYHQVLQTHLELLLADELGGRAAREHYSRSAALLEQAGRTAAAVRAHARAEDWGSVARLLQADAAPAVGDEAMWGALTLPGAPTDEPGLVLAGARRLARDGQIREAVAAFRQAEDLLDDPDFRRRCAVERAAIAVWAPHASLPPLPSGSARDTNAELLRLAVQLRQMTLQLRNPDASARPLVRGVAAVLAGDIVRAEREFARSSDDLAAPAWEPLAVRLILRAIEAWRDPSEGVAGQVEEIMLSADVAGWPWLSRIARVAQAATLLIVYPNAWRITGVGELLDQLERRGDRWSFCLAGLALGTAYATIGELELAARTLDRAAATAVDLGAPVLEAWATSLGEAALSGPGSGTIQRRTVPVRTGDALGITRLREVTAALGDQLNRGRRGNEPTASPPVTDKSVMRLRCLGGFSLTSDDVELPWSTLRPRARSLLMLLAMNHARPIHRERLVDALWPDATLTSGIRSLQVAVSSIRQCLAAGGIAEDALYRRGDAYALRIPEAHDELVDFERLARQADREPPDVALESRRAALDLYGGDLLPEVGPAEWVVEERTRMRLLAAVTATEIAAGALASGQLRMALDAARRSLALDPYHDSAWHLVVTIYERLGDHSAAAVARREQARVWADLGLVAPTRTPVP